MTAGDGAGEGVDEGAGGLPPRLRDDCFALPPGVSWTPAAEALERLREACVPVCEARSVPLERALGAILAEPVRAARDNPPQANSAVDGYAFAHASLRGADPETLTLLPGRAAAGRPFAGRVPPGAALRVLTGAVIPEGCDTVVMQEDAAAEGGVLRLRPGLKKGANLRRAAEDFAAGEAILPQGRRLAPQDLALAAAAGLAELPVRRPLRVAVLSTGDELRPPGAPLAPGQLHDANRPMLLGLARAWGFEARDLGCAPDDRDALRAALDAGAAEADAILTTGGASAGDEDHVSAILRAEGALNLWRVAIKPGRPLALATWRGAAVFGLPGNPVAAFVCALIFARPALLRLAGARWELPRGRALPAAFAKRRKPGRREYLRARLDAEGRVEVFRSEGSGLVSGLSWAEGLCELPEDGAEIRPGDPVRFVPFSEFGL
ncbi:molybdopterin-binding protein [Oceanicella actignis]|uniref:molybdopterin-binding protein n=1 Tax=Oceanicella actignis TaxID=1189325 RepID=UPI0011E76D51|nr:gephyrin-like molybdotransferase Glp [Oceanicella actignis]TYO85438.1 molybdopterin molybdotransferase [Oceanicella actignis]